MNTSFAFKEAKIKWTSTDFITNRKVGYQQNVELYNKYLSYINLSFNIICQNFCKESTAQYYPHLKKFSDNFVPVSCPLFTGTRCIARSKIQNYANK